MREGQDVLATALENQNPGAYDAFLAANSANRHLNVLGNALTAAKGQVNDAGVALPTPNQFNTAATQSGTTYGSKLQAAMGNKPFFHADPNGGAPISLINDAQQVMTNQLAESGTVPRAIVATALAGGAGGGLGALTGSGPEGVRAGTVGGLSALALLNTRAGQAAAVRALLERTPNFRNLGEYTINDLAPRVGQASGLAGVIGGQSLLPPR
ncbi:MAG TPA: hypothetical protein VNJ04_06975 [Gemmatimonadaceae bacterium]|nr:hypothetical protein [Gemmatimonadaceae bacterium]